MFSDKKSHPPVLSSDVSGSSKHIEEPGHGAIARSQSQHAGLARTSSGRYQERLVFVERNSCFLVCFESPDSLPHVRHLDGDGLSAAFVFTTQELRRAIDCLDRWASLEKAFVIFSKPGNNFFFQACNSFCSLKMGLLPENANWVSLRISLWKLVDKVQSKISCSKHPSGCFGAKIS